MDEINKADLKTLTNIRAKFKKGLVDYQLINENDHILIGLSGGKDSLALVQLLGEQMRIFAPKFKVTAAHISVESISYQSDLDYLRGHCEQYNIPFVHKTTGFDRNQVTTKPTCFLCSWHRRKALFELAKELKCNKLALGHHLDDIVETFLLNLVYQGATASMPVKLKMDKFDLTIIRPLCLLTEKQMNELERIENYQKQLKNCPYEKESSRRDAKNLISELEKWNPEVRQSLWAAMQNVKSDYLPKR